MFLPAAFPADPLVLAPAGAISVTDAQGRVLLSVSPLDASQWPARLGVLVQTDQGDQTTFDLEVLHQPSGGGVGVSLPVVLERFAALTPTLAYHQPAQPVLAPGQRRAAAGRRVRTHRPG